MQSFGVISNVNINNRNWKVKCVEDVRKKEVIKQTGCLLVLKWNWEPRF